MGRVLGLDYGTRRIGVALSDPTASIAMPHCVLEPRGLRDALEQIRAICAERQVERIVVGLPRSLDGHEGPSAEAARSFADRVRDAVDLPVVLWDERFSTVSAQRALIEGGARRAKRRQVVDKLAAQIFLQHYLDAGGGAPLPLPDELP